MVSKFGSVDTYAAALTRDERVSQVVGAGPCDFITVNGGISRNKVANLENAIHAYEAALNAACGTVQHCTYDGGAFGGIVDRREYFSDDLKHLSIKGQATAAAVAWSAMRRAHVVAER